MLHLIPKTNIDFIGKRYFFFCFTGLLLLSGIISLTLKGGPRWGLDFTGGTLVEVKFKDPLSLEEVRKALTSANIPSFEIQSVSGQGYIIRTQLVAGKDNKDQDVGVAIVSAITQSFPNESVDILRKEFVGPSVGKHLGRQTLTAFLLTFVGIIIYVGFRFRSGVWGVSGVFALVHDVLATVGVFSMCNKEISVTVVAALLTIAGYSITDTIVIYDFMRERLRMRKTESMGELINRSLNETLSRTIITSLTVFMVSVVLFFFGGEVIHDFAFAMVFGVAIGTYSSIAVAAPMIYEWEMHKNKAK